LTYARRQGGAGNPVFRDSSLGALWTNIVYSLRDLCQENGEIWTKIIYSLSDLCQENGESIRAQSSIRKTCENIDSLKKKKLLIDLYG
jgi:rRNA maturation protein Nop10